MPINARATTYTYGTAGNDIITAQYLLGDLIDGLGGDAASAVQLRQGGRHVVTGCRPDQNDVTRTDQIFADTAAAEELRVLDGRRSAQADDQIGSSPQLCEGARELSPVLQRAQSIGHRLVVGFRA